MLIKKRMIIITLILFFFLITYYLYIVIDTHNIMVKLKKIENGEIVYDFESKNPLARFGRENGSIQVDVASVTRTYGIRRYFTWCWGRKGQIWLTCVDKIEWEDGRICEGRDWCSLKIEKINGTWEVVQYINQP